MATAEHDFESVPVVDVSALVDGGAGEEAVREAAEAIGHACRHVGFFYVREHGVPAELVARLFERGKAFFAQDEEAKMRSDMRQSDCYRGYFPLGGELTGGRKDWKAGLYFGAELEEGHPEPMHGPNVWPELPGLREAVTEYMERVTALGHALMEGVALSLGLERDFFRRQFTSQPFTPFRLFYYPRDPSPAETSGGADRDGSWGVGRHTDYGVLTILAQDDSGGLQVENSRGEWIDAPPVPGTFVVNIGDMLETWTGGAYRATPHRVVKQTRANRMSAPFFFDPNFRCVVRPLPGVGRTPAGGAEDGEGTLYGRYILNKVENNFPELRASLAAAGGKASADELA